MSAVVSSQLSPANNLKRFVSNKLSEIIQSLEAIDINNERGEFDYVLYKLEQIVHIGVRSDEQGLWQQVFPEELLYTLIEAYNKLVSEDLPGNASNTGRRPETINTSSVGQPALEIPKETLKLFLNYGFSFVKISEMLGVSTKTVSRRIKFFNLQEDIPKYTSISNEALDAIVSEIYQEFPNCGIRRMKGFLTSRGIQMQWERVRSSLWRIDSAGILLRSMQLNLVNRRHYSVPGPLYLWHLDGNHKLIRWGFVIHGCVPTIKQTQYLIFL